jgi:alcohol dehydrogenase class IV
MTIASLNLPSTILMGAGASKELPAQLKRLGARHALIVTDAFFKHNGLADSFVALLRQNDMAASVFAEVQPDPTDVNVAAGLAAYRESGADCVVAIGGGSSMDCAKAISLLIGNPGPLRQYMGYHKVPNAGAPLVCIPTTAGTGSEATRVAVITDTERHEKMMILDGHLTPTIALVDFELSLSMPKPLTAHVGVDTLTHGIEAYVSKKANGMTDPLALSCIALVANNLLTAWREPDNRAAREAMALAAFQGGAAFANASVCLVHGMSRPLGAVYHVPHGLSNAVLLPAVTKFSISGAMQRYGVVAQVMGLATGSDDAEAAAHKLVDGLEYLNDALQIPPLRDCVKVGRAKFEQSLEKLAQDALASGSPQNNPVVPSAEQMVGLYKEAW